MRKSNLQLPEDNGFADFYDADEVDGCINEIEGLYMKGDTSEHATSVNMTINRVLKILRG